MVDGGIEAMMKQFSTFMLKELNRCFVDYEVLKMGNAAAYENVKALLHQAKDQLKPLRVRSLFPFDRFSSVFRILEQNAKR